ncbi:MAG: ATP-binding cassette domain-containing protein, partial [Muricauda sp.]
IGPNGSGKSTLLSMITGDSHKGYGQDLTIFGQKKGSGESIWDLKQKIGYYTPAITDKFRGYHSLEHMIISGLHDSIGLYVQPTDSEIKLARQWLQLLQLEERKKEHFRDLSDGDKRLVMMARAMVKHPPLLILDEPTAGLDDASASLFVALVNKIAKESETAIVFVSHRKEPQLEPTFIYELYLGEKGSKGTQVQS